MQQQTPQSHCVIAASRLHTSFSCIGPCLRLWVHWEGYDWELGPVYADWKRRYYIAAKLGAGTIGLLLVDWVGRKPLLVGGGALMVVFQVCVASLMGVHLDPHKPKSKLPPRASDGLLASICLFVATYSLSWGEPRSAKRCQDRQSLRQKMVVQTSVNVVYTWSKDGVLPWLECGSCDLDLRKVSQEPRTGSLQA